MTVAEIIDRFNIERPNQTEDSVKVPWLKQVEWTIYNDVIKMYDDVDLELEDFDMDSELIVPVPFEDIYINWLDAKIGFNSGDTGRYTRAMTQYNNLLLNYQQFYNRSTTPNRTRRHIIDHARML